MPESREVASVVSVDRTVEQSADRQRPVSGLVAVVGSSLSALLSALLSAATCGLLLLVNGSITYVVLESFGPLGGNGMTGEGVTQFFLFTVPVALLVVEWLMWDLAVSILTRSWSETD